MVTVRVTACGVHLERHRIEPSAPASTPHILYLRLVSPIALSAVRTSPLRCRRNHDHCVIPDTCWSVPTRPPLPPSAFHPQPEDDCLAPPSQSATMRGSTQPCDALRQPASRAASRSTKPKNTGCSVRGWGEDSGKDVGARKTWRGGR
eukprot:3481967-Rhodomonas_salina.3